MKTAAIRFAAHALGVGSLGPISFELKAGCCLALSGPSGAGKTRLLRAMADLDAHAGTCCLDGHPMHEFDAPTWRRQVSYLAAESAWWAETPIAHLAVERNRLAPLLTALDLAPALLDRPMAKLSSGQRQRLAVTRLLAQTPAVLLLDEPTANLDADNIARVETRVAGYCEQRSACAVWVGHDRDQLMRVSDQWIVLDAHGGIKEQSGSPMNVNERK